MKTRTTILYADADAARTRTITKALDAAGYRVLPCSGTVLSSLPDHFTRPDLVVLHTEIGESLKGFIEALWPGVRYIILDEPENTLDLVAAIKSALEVP